MDSARIADISTLSLSLFQEESSLLISEVSEDSTPVMLGKHLKRQLTENLSV